MFCLDIVQKFLDNYERKKENLLKITIFYVTGIISGLAITFLASRHDRRQARRAGRRIVDWEDAPLPPTAPLDYNDPASLEPPPFLRWSYNEDVGCALPAVTASDDETVERVTAGEAAERYGLRPEHTRVAAADKSDKHMVMTWSLADDLDRTRHSLAN